MPEMPTMVDLMENQTNIMKAIVQISQLCNSMTQEITRLNSRVTMLEGLLLGNGEVK